MSSHYYWVILVFTVFIILLTNSQQEGQNEETQIETQNVNSKLLADVKRSIPSKKRQKKKKQQNKVIDSKNQKQFRKGKKNLIKKIQKIGKMKRNGGKKKNIKKKKRKNSTNKGGMKKNPIKGDTKKKHNKGGKKKELDKGGKNTKKQKSSKGPNSRASADNEIFEGPYGFEHPEAIDWTLPQYRCPDCEDTLIIYDPWFAPPPTLHIPVFCTSNLSEFSRSNSFSNFGPNITFIFIPGTLNCTDPNKARQLNNKQFSIEITQKSEDEEETAVEPQQSVNGLYDCGKSVTQDMSYMSCGEKEPAYGTDETSKKCFWHFHAYEHWRRQLKFTSWSLPSCLDNSTKGDCCKEGPHLLISKTGYAKKFEAYCGPEAPNFSKSDFEKGKARWLVVYNNTGNTDNFTPKVALEAPTIGYRKSAAFDQLYYGERCLCGLRKNKHPAVDPENGQGRKLGNKGGKKKNLKTKNKKTKVKKLKVTRKKKKGKGKRNKLNRKAHQNKKRQKNIKSNNKKENGMKNIKVKRIQTEKIKSVGRREVKQFVKQNKKKYKNRKITKTKGKIKKKGKGKKKKKKIKNGKKKNKGGERKNKGGKRNNKTIKKKTNRQAAAADVGPQDRTKPVWPWMASVTYSDLYTCTGYIISPLIVITTTKCFADMETVRGDDAETISALNTNKDKIVVIGQDEQDIGRADPAHYWEEERTVDEILIHPNCDPVSSPQFCVFAFILSQNFSMTKQERPRPACLNCQVDSYKTRLLKGNPFLASYGLQDPQQAAKAGTYKAPSLLKSYLSTSCITRNLNTSETYCLKVLGERYRCDVEKITVGGNKELGKRDYGGLLMNRVGRNGYKINFQVVGLLWNFNCGNSGPAEYIPTWPSLAWMVNLMMSRDRPCTKLIRKSDWTRNVKTDGYYGNGNLI